MRFSTLVDVAPISMLWHHFEGSITHLTKYSHNWGQIYIMFCNKLTLNQERIILIGKLVYGIKFMTWLK